MQTEHGRIDRRTLLKVMGSVGATATIGLACRTVENTVSAQGLTGGKFEKTVALATAGPGGNRAWQPGDAVNFLPPGGNPDARQGLRPLAALPKEKLLHLYDRMNASRKWETTMKDLFLSAGRTVCTARSTPTWARKRSPSA